MAAPGSAAETYDVVVVVLFLWSVVHGLVTIFMACDPKELLAETGCCDEVDEKELTIGLFGRFRDMVRVGLEPVAVRGGGDDA